MDNNIDCSDCQCSICTNTECKENNHCRGCHEYSQSDHIVDIGTCENFIREI